MRLRFFRQLLWRALPAAQSIVGRLCQTPLIPLRTADATATSENSGEGWFRPVQMPDEFLRSVKMRLNEDSSRAETIETKPAETMIHPRLLRHRHRHDLHRRYRCLRDSVLPFPKSDCLALRLATHCSVTARSAHARRQAF